MRRKIMLEQGNTYARNAWRRKREKENNEVRREEKESVSAWNTIQERANLANEFLFEAKIDSIWHNLLN